MSPDQFQHLLSMVVPPLISEKSWTSRTPISPQEKLILTLRFLASENSQQSQSFGFRLGKATVCNAIFETTLAVWISFKSPSSEGEFIRLAKEFEREWYFPNCLGAFDRKDVAIECPRGSGSAYFNYKKNSAVQLSWLCMTPNILLHW